VSGRVPIRTLARWTGEFDRISGAERYAARDFAEWLRTNPQAGEAGGHRVVERG
jgi:hypothetical protein